MVSGDQWISEHLPYTTVFLPIFFLYSCSPWNFSPAFFLPVTPCIHCLLCLIHILALLKGSVPKEVRIKFCVLISKTRHRPQKTWPWAYADLNPGFITREVQTPQHGVPHPCLLYELCEGLQRLLILLLWSPQADMTVIVWASAVLS